MTPRRSSACGWRSWKRRAPSGTTAPRRPSGGSTFPGARRLSVRRGLARLGYTDEALADHIADAFTELRRAEYRLYPDAHATVDALRQRGVKLALVTNGAAEPARQDRALRPQPSLRPHPDRGRVRHGQARARRLPPCARAAGLRRLRCLDGRRQLRMGSRGAAEARPVRHLVRPVRGRHSRARHGQADARDQAAGGAAGESRWRPVRGADHAVTVPPLHPSFGSLSVVFSISRSTRPPSTRWVCSTSSMSCWSPPCTRRLRDRSPPSARARSGRGSRRC